MPQHLAYLQQKARILSQVRAFFAARNVMEVDVPCLDTHAVTDPHLTNFVCDWQGQSLYLQTSPEFAMKRLLSDGVGDCYYLGKAFRNEARSVQHSPEFMLLEWYRVGMSPNALMDEIDALLAHVLDTPQAERISYSEAFAHFVGLDLHTATLDALLARLPIDPHFDPQREHRDDIIQWLFTFVVEPAIGQSVPCFVYDFPIAQAALAKANPDGRTAQRFELYYRGVELANGYGELTDSQIQAERFAQDNAKREALGLPQVTPDARLIHALQRGMPDVSGVALGMDRLCMLATGATDIAQVQVI